MPITHRDPAASHGVVWDTVFAPSQRMPSSSRRALYRVVYPLHERPLFVVGRYTFDVIDCSELGLRYSVKDRRLPALGTAIGGTVEFKRGGSVEVTGEVIRTRGATVALALDTPGVPFGDILAEQRYLRSRGYTLRD